MRYWHILKWLNDSHVRQWDHHVDDRSIKSNFSVPFRVAKQSRRSHVKKDHKVNSFDGRKRNCESSSLTFENFFVVSDDWTNCHKCNMTRSRMAVELLDMFGPDSLSSSKYYLLLLQSGSCGQICHVNILLEFFLIKSFFFGILIINNI